MRKQKMLPRISDTERQALEAGTVWVDGEFFRGRLDLSRMLSEPYDSLSEEEQAFLDGPTEALCQLTDAEQVADTGRVPAEVLDFIRKEGFMGLIVPREYGGKDFSTLGVSSVMSKVTAHSTAMGTFVSIPNSLGAAELLRHYGTDAQKDHYLPRLARGEYIPCFGLTELTAGSDAVSIRAEGEVVAGDDGRPRIRLNFAKRYITLAPAADLISLAFRLHDPQDLLGAGTDPGITVALIHRDAPGLTIGDHHRPIGDGFYNGPLSGKDVLIEPDAIIGGAEGAGQGWRMLMEQLAGGRAVSLPAGSVGAMKYLAAVTGAYSMVRSQFGIDIGHMEGVQAKVARIAAMTHLFEAARVYSCSALDHGEQPPVISALLKMAASDYARRLAVDAMDVFAGSGVMQGPNNLVGRAYTNAPVSVTVEGANIMTRTLIVFGQGATRCHPHALELVNAVEADDVDGFRTHLLGWLGHTARTWLRTKWLGLTRGWGAPSPVGGPAATYHRRLAWAAARFALLTDLAMFGLGGRLKARGNLSGRFADALAWQFLALATLRRFEAEGRRKEDLPLVRYACDYALARVQEAFEGIHANFDVPVVGWWLRHPAAWFLRMNRLSDGPSDRLVPLVAATVQKPGEQYDRLTAGLARIEESGEGAGRLLRAFRLRTETAELRKRLHKASREHDLPHGTPAELIDAALAAGVIDRMEADRLHDAEAATLAAWEVDVFPPEGYFRDAPEPAAASRAESAQRFDQAS